MRASVLVVALLLGGASAALGAPGAIDAATPPGPESPVADAARRGDVAAVLALIAAGADVDAAHADGMTGLHWAAEHGSAELARVLLDAGAHPNPATRLGAYTPLHIAARGSQDEVARALLAAGADAHAATTTGGVTPLHFAAAAGSLGTVEALLDGGADPDARERAWDRTPLMFAAAPGHTGVVRRLLAAGADPSAVAFALDMAARDREDGADQRARDERLSAAAAGTPPPPTPARSGAGAPTARPPASEPAAAPPTAPSREEIYERQRDREPEPLSHAELIGGYGGLTPLLLAVREGRTETALALVDAGAGIDQPSHGDGTTPLLMATINGHFDLALALLERGADPNAASHAGARPLYTTLNTEWIPKSRHPQPTARTQQRTTYLELVEALLVAGADPNARLNRELWFTTFGDDYLGVDRMGATAFWRAAYALDVEAMKLLVRWGADPNIPTAKPPERRRGGRAAEADPSGLPPVPVGGPAVWPIHAASGVGYGEGFAANIHRHVPGGWLTAVRYLVEELGVDPIVRDHNGYNAVHHAAARGDDALILYLVERGVDVTQVSRSGQTTADMANGPVQRISPFPETVALLERLGSKNNHNCVGC